MRRQLNLYRVDAETNRYDTVNDLMTDVRAADSYRDIRSGLFDLELEAGGLQPGKGILVWLSEEEDDE